MSTQPTVFIIDDDDNNRKMLRCLIESIGLQLKDFDSAQEFLENYDREQHGCLITDVRMRGISGLELLEKLRAENIYIPVIITTGHADISMTVRAMKSGAFDFFEKPINNQVLIERIQQAIEYDAKIRQEYSEQQELLKRVADLTTREYEVMIQAIKGNSNKEIARELSISDKTVEAHRAKVMEKMQATHFADLVRMGVVCNLL
jgi:two-component system response regulator FixJ